LCPQLVAVIWHLVILNIYPCQHPRNYLGRWLPPLASHVKALWDYIPLTSALLLTRRRRMDTYPSTKRGIRSFIGENMSCGLDKLCYSLQGPPHTRTSVWCLWLP
jgi:hypothetical protein